MKLLILALLALPLCAFAAPKKPDCVGAEKVSKEFTLAAVNGKRSESYAMMDSAQWTRDGFENAVKKQFRTLLGKEIFHSVPAFDRQEFNQCRLDQQGRSRLSINRILLGFEGENGMARVLPMNVDLRKEKNGKWVVTSFASTAM